MASEEGKVKEREGDGMVSGEGGGGRGMVW